MSTDQGILMFSLHFMNIESLYCKVWIAFLVLSIEEKELYLLCRFFSDNHFNRSKGNKKCNSFIYSISKFKHPLEYNLTQNMECEVCFDTMERKCNELSTSVLLCITSFTIESLVNFSILVNFPIFIAYKIGLLFKLEWKISP